MWKLVLVLSTCLVQCWPYKILVVSPVPAKSHAILGEAIVRNLMKAGHEVTIITAFPMKNPPPKLHQVDVSSNIKLFPAQLVSLKKLLDREVAAYDAFTFFKVIKNITRATSAHANVQKLLQDREQKFDLVIVEWFFTETYVGFSLVFDCPLIWFSSVEPHWMVLELIDEKPNPAYNVDIHSITLIHPLSFYGRMVQLGIQLAGTLFRKIFFESFEDDLYYSYYAPAMASRGVPLVPFNVAKYNASLMLGNSHATLGEATRLPQNYKPIGGYHIERNVEPLPEDLQYLMDFSDNGVIYFSMGSNLKGKDWPEELKRNLMEIFGELNQTVIWKFEDTLFDVPENVHILPWAPQSSILAHPKCVLFITHGGLLSIIETIYHGVPIIGIPAFADQFVNVNRAVKKGFARKVSLTYYIAEDLEEAIPDVIYNRTYKKKVMELSLAYHDRPMMPAKELVFWSEHVIKTGGAPHLRSPALMLPWYQKAYLDLLAVVLAIIYLIYFVISMCRCCCKKITGVHIDDSKKKN